MSLTEWQITSSFSEQDFSNFKRDFWLLDVVSLLMVAIARDWFFFFRDIEDWLELYISIHFFYKLLIIQEHLTWTLEKRQHLENTAHHFSNNLELLLTPCQHPQNFPQHPTNTLVNFISACHWGGQWEGKHLISLYNQPGNPLFGINPGDITFIQAVFSYLII